MPSEPQMLFRRHFIIRPFESGDTYSELTKIRTRRRAADSTNSTEPIHLVLQHLRESFSLS
ncbi:hypothetical protein M5099_03975 [Neisseria meningitidis]|uniref:Transposase n=1 Tax=Neisseria meningitidis TaxID=487 RepID=X5ESI7_NEIME|nr:hypothetical protein [Neisseria meningitidis]AHW76481.1 transposase [Neisseria meningitidis]MBG9182278.1 hypothetical protein [Neisseria meningitidis]MBG9196556.1 hypothetical protein [Neisseria meningitidis]MBJ1808283.1 hypothetical protein [Neisseria meningitidis]MBJ1810319.1 hypothetical protein [Neisseria meningitidis]